MTNTFKIFCIILSFLTTSVFAASYTVKKGDTLANIARKRYGEPVFGPKGTIYKILNQNPNLKMNVPLEPGQKINLESGTVAYPPEKVPNAKPPPLPAESQAPKFDATPFEKAAKQMDMMPRAPIKEAEEDAKVEVVPKVCKHCGAKNEAEEHDHGQAAPPHHDDQGHSPHNYLSIIPQYSMITQTASEHPESFTMHSSPAWGAEFGWDHWWNSSFSTVLTFTALQFTSRESSALTGTKVFSKMLSKGEIALLNRLAPWIRFGLGMAYGEHVFLEGFPADARSVKVGFMNPFVTAEITAFESARFEVPVSLKIGKLPAQHIDGHEILAGTEYAGQVSLVQKLAKFSMLYGIAFSSEDQSLSGGSESRQEWALRIGALF